MTQEKFEREELRVGGARSEQIDVFIDFYVALLEDVRASLERLRAMHFAVTANQMKTPAASRRDECQTVVRHYVQSARSLLETWSDWDGEQEIRALVDGWLREPTYISPTRRPTRPSRESSRVLMEPSVLPISTDPLPVVSLDADFISAEKVLCKPGFVELKYKAGPHLHYNHVICPGRDRSEGLANAARKLPQQLVVMAWRELLLSDRHASDVGAGRPDRHLFGHAKSGPAVGGRVGLGSGQGRGASQHDPPAAFYTFKLVLAGGQLDDVSVARLLAAGCDDAVLSEEQGVCFAAFDREAASFEEAVVSAIADVERSGTEFVVQQVGPDDLVSASVIAERVGRTRQNIAQLIAGHRGPGGFPPPVSGGGARSRVWRWSEVERWLAPLDGIDISPDAARSSTFIAAVNGALQMRRGLEQYRKAGGTAGDAVFGLAAGGQPTVDRGRSG